VNGKQWQSQWLSIALGSSVMGMVWGITTPPAIAEQISLQVTQANPLEERATQFVDLVFSQQYEDALSYLHPDFRQEVESSFAERAEAFLGTTGAFQERQDSQVVENVVFINAQFEKVTDTIVIIFDETGLITGLDFPVAPLQTIE